MNKGLHIDGTYKEIPDRCVQIVDNVAEEPEIHIKMTAEDLQRLPAYISSEYDELTDIRGLVIPAPWVKLIRRKLPPTIYGYEKKDIEMARMLLAEGITPFELKQHYHDFNWVADILRKDLEKQMQKAFNEAISKMETTTDTEKSSATCSKTEQVGKGEE